MNLILPRRRLWLSREQSFVFLVIAAIIVTNVQGKSPPRNSFASRKFGQVPKNVDKSLRRSVPEIHGGFSSLTQDETATAESTGSPKKPSPSNNQQSFPQSDEAIVPSTAQDSTSLSQPITTNKNLPGAWPCMDELDKSLIKISLPVIANFAIAPLVGTIDLFFINRMGNALAVAGQAASNQVFGSVFWLTSFLPSRKLSYPPMY